MVDRPKWHELDGVAARERHARAIIWLVPDVLWHECRYTIDPDPL